jgi:hypothetical protein
MARKRRPGKFSVVKAVKLNARTQVGQPPASRVFVEKNRLGEKHKTTLAERLAAGRDEG